VVTSGGPGIGSFDETRELRFQTNLAIYTNGKVVSDRLRIHKGEWSCTELKQIMHGLMISADTWFAENNLPAITHVSMELDFGGE
jgi:hypothetical protein